MKLNKSEIIKLIKVRIKQKIKANSKCSPSELKMTVTLNKVGAADRKLYTVQDRL